MVWVNKVKFKWNSQHHKQHTFKQHICHSSSNQMFLDLFINQVKAGSSEPLIVQGEDFHHEWALSLPVIIITPFCSEISSKSALFADENHEDLTHSVAAPFNSAVYLIIYITVCYVMLSVSLAQYSNSLKSCSSTRSSAINHPDEVSVWAFCCCGCCKVLLLAGKLLIYKLLGAACQMLLACWTDNL